MMINGTVVMQCSRTQATRAVSAAASRYCAIVTETAEGLDCNRCCRIWD